IVAADGLIACERAVGHGQRAMEHVHDAAAQALAASGGAASGATRSTNGLVAADGRVADGHGGGLVFDAAAVLRRLRSCKGLVAGNDAGLNVERAAGEVHDSAANAEGGRAVADGLVASDRGVAEVHGGSGTLVIEGAAVAFDPISSASHVAGEGTVADI